MSAGAPMWRYRASGLPAKAPQGYPALGCPHTMMSPGGGIRRPIMATAAAAPSPGSQPLHSPQLRPQLAQRSWPHHSNSTTTSRGVPSSTGKTGVPMPGVTRPVVTAAAAAGRGIQARAQRRPPPITVSALCSILKDLNSSSTQAKLGGRWSPERLTELCQEATAGLKQCGDQLPAREFSYLGSSLSLWQAGGALGKQWPPLVPVVAATISAAMQAPAMTTVSVRGWSELLYGVAKAGVRAQGLDNLMAHALTLITPEAWVVCASQERAPQVLSNLVWAYATAGYDGDVSGLLSGVSSSMAAGGFATANEQDCSNMLWALATLGCSKEQPHTTAVVEQVVLAMLQSGMQQATPQAWANLLWALATMGYSAAPGSQPDIRPLVASLVGYVEQGGMQQATPQAWSTLLWALAKSHAVHATVQPVLALGLPFMIRRTNSGGCTVKEIAQVMEVVGHYGMPGEKGALLAGMPPALQVEYNAQVLELVATS